MQIEKMFAQGLQPSGLNLVFLMAAIVCAIVSIFRRKKAIGGWLFYFYYWIFAFLVAYAADALQNARVFVPSYYPRVINHEALVLAVFPRFFGMLAVVVVALVLLVNREKAWLERLRIVLLAEVVIAGVSVLLDIWYFPRSTYSNASRWIGLCLWVLYFYISKRVQRVFGTKDSAAPPLVARVMT